MSSTLGGVGGRFLLVVAALGVGYGSDAHLPSISPRAEASDSAPPERRQANARVVASGIPGAGAIQPVGSFHRGGPIRDSPTWIPFTQPGAVLDPSRIVVASTSNFGAPLARPGEPEGSILSIDVGGAPVEVPPSFARLGGQAAALGGRVRIFTAQSPAFLNSVNNPRAATAALPATSLPRGISFNIAFGRPWLANAPNGAEGDGTITVLDADGRPLAGAPSAVAGGVFAGDLTNRDAGTSRGLRGASLATALLTRSPDGTTRAVFVSVQADGSVQQVHVEKGVSALAPPESITPLTVVDRRAAESADANVFSRVGVAFNWVPTFNLFVTDPKANRVLVLDLTPDGTFFVAAPARYLYSWAFDAPVDVAATIPEFAAGNFSSGTTLGGGADLYVLNRGNNTIVRIDQHGRPMAIRAIRPDWRIRGFRAAGIAVSPDGRTLYVTATAPGGQGFVLTMDAFGASLVTQNMVARAVAAGADDLGSLGRDMFTRPLGIFDLVGPLFNGRSCAECHNLPTAGGASADAASEFKFARVAGGEAEAARRHSIRELGVRCRLQPGVPAGAATVSPRHAMTLLGDGLIDSIQDRDWFPLIAAQPVEIRGRINVQPDGRPGKFGWKARFPFLVEFMGDAFRTEQGITNPLEPNDLVQGCGADLLRPEIDGTALTAVTGFISTRLDPPDPSPACLASAGSAVFASIGCAGCHIPAIPSEGKQARLYSDLALHDMGPGLADGLNEAGASGSEFRTMPLWRVSERVRHLHDGRATSIEGAILEHGGQAEAAKHGFQALSPADRRSLLDFLNCI
jgi:di-heme oxidoreductase (putative peroxidase)